jgi:ADP-ribose pyrophosphatase YjhB (NUDIX family)
MNYCSNCSAPVTVRVPTGDNLPRYCCDNCGTVHYRNPLVVAGCIVETDDGLLLCRRAIEPRAGFWTMPAGFMENGETLAEAAQRETREEACAEVELLGLHSIVSVVGAHQVHVMYRGRLVGGYSAGAESTEVRVFDVEALPWDELAFRSVRAAFERYRDDHRDGRFRLHEMVIR